MHFTSGNTILKFSFEQRSFLHICGDDGFFGPNFKILHAAYFKNMFQKNKKKSHYHAEQWLEKSHILCNIIIPITVHLMIITGFE